MHTAIVSRNDRHERENDKII